MWGFPFLGGVRGFFQADPCVENKDYNPFVFFGTKMFVAIHIGENMRCGCDLWVRDVILSGKHVAKSFRCISCKEKKLENIFEKKFILNFRD